MQKWVSRLVDSLTAPSAASDAVRWADRHLVLEFKKLWDDFRNAPSDRESTDILNNTLEVFCRLLTGQPNVADHIHSLVEVQPFSFVVARQLVLVPDVQQLPPDRLVDFFTTHVSGGPGSGATLLTALEYLTAPGVELQGLLDAGLLAKLLSLHAAVAAGDSRLQQQLVQRRLENLMKALADHKGAASSLVDDDSLKQLFYIAATDGCLPDEGIFVPPSLSAAASIEKLKQRSHVCKILSKMLSSNSGSVASYIKKHRLVEVLLKAIIQFDADTGDSHHALSVVALVLDCLKLSNKSGAGGVQLMDDFKGMRGYTVMGQLSLKLTFAPHSQALSPTALRETVSLPSPPLLSFNAVVEAAIKAAKAQVAEVQPLMTDKLRGIDLSEHEGDDSFREGIYGNGTPAEAPSQGVSTIDRTSSLSLWSSSGSIAETTASVQPDVEAIAPALIKLLDLLVAMACESMTSIADGSEWKVGQISAGSLEGLSASDGGKEESLEWQIRDSEAVQVLQDLFLQTKQVPVQLLVLDRLQSIYAGHPDNYAVMRDLRTLPRLIRGMAAYHPVLQEQILKLLEFTVLVISVVPEQELLALCAELERPVPPTMARNALAFFSKLLSFDLTFQDICRTVGLLDILILDVQRCAISSVVLSGSGKAYLRSCNSPTEPGSVTFVGGSSVDGGGLRSPAARGQAGLESPGRSGKWRGASPAPLTGDSAHRRSASLGPAAYLFGEAESRSLGWDCLVALLQRNAANRALFRDRQGGLQALLPLLACSDQRGGLLRVCHCLVSDDINQGNLEDFAALVQAVKKGQVAAQGGRLLRLDVVARADILWALGRLVRGSSGAQEAFLKAEGFALVLPLLQSIRVPDWPLEPKGGWGKSSAAPRGGGPDSLAAAAPRKVSTVGGGGDHKLHSVADASAVEPSNRSGLRGGSQDDVSGRGTESDRVSSKGSLEKSGEGEDSHTQGNHQKNGEQEERGLLGILAEVSKSQGEVGTGDGMGEVGIVMKMKRAPLPQRLPPSGVSLQIEPRDVPLANKLELVDALFQLLTVAVKSMPLGRVALRDGLRVEAVKKLLPATGLLVPLHEERIVEMLFQLATETDRKLSKPGRRQIQVHRKGVEDLEKVTDQDWLKVDVDAYLAHLTPGTAVSGGGPESDQVCVFNAVAVQALLEVLPQLSAPMQLRLLVNIHRLANMSIRNVEALCGVGSVSILMEFIRPYLGEMATPLCNLVLCIVQELGTFRLSAMELRTLAWYMRQSKDSPNQRTGEVFLSMLERMCMDGGPPQGLAVGPLLHLSFSRLGYGCAKALIGDRPWPPVGGYTFTCSLSFRGLLQEGCIPISKQSNLVNEAMLPIFSVGAADDSATFLTQIQINSKGHVVLSSGPNSRVVFTDVHLEEGLWHDVTIVFSRPNALAGFFQTSTASLYVNGSLRQSGRLGCGVWGGGQPLQVVLGAAEGQARPRPLSWLLGAAALFEDALPAPAALLLHALGRNYPGTFQDDDLGQFVPLEACNGHNLTIAERLEKEAALTGGGLWSTGEEEMAGDGAEACKVIWDERFPIALISMLSSKKLIFKFSGTTVELCPTDLARTMVNLVNPGSSAASTVGGIPQMAGLHGDVQICSPCGVADGIRKIGGVAVVLAMVEIADSQQKLHLAISLLAGTLSHNVRNVRDMKQVRGYHLLALFLHQRMPLLGMEGLDLLLQIAATDGACRGGERGTTGERDSGEAGGLPSLVLANRDMVKDVLLDWTLWVRAPVALQMALLSFLERTVLHNRYRRHNMALLRQLNVVEDLLATLQRGDLEVVVMERAVRLLGTILACEPVESELTQVAHFIIMTFKPSMISHSFSLGGEGRGMTDIGSMTAKGGGAEGAGLSNVDGSLMAGGYQGSVRGPREPLGPHVMIRNALLEMIVKLQLMLKSEENVEFCRRVASTKVAMALLDEEVHPSTLRWVLVMLLSALHSSVNVATRFRNWGGFQYLQQVLPRFNDEPEVYYLLAAVLCGKLTYPRLQSVRLADFLNLLPESSEHEEVHLPCLLDSFIAALKAAFQQRQRAQPSHSAGGAPRGRGGQAELQAGGADPPAALPLSGGVGGAARLAATLLQFLISGATRWPEFASACRQLETLQSLVEMYFYCVSSVVPELHNEPTTLLRRQSEVAIKIQNGGSAHSERGIFNGERLQTHQEEHGRGELVKGNERDWGKDESRGSGGEDILADLAEGHAPASMNNLPAIVTSESLSPQDTPSKGSPLASQVSPLLRAGTMSSASMLTAWLGSSTIGEALSGYSLGEETCENIPQQGPDASVLLSIDAAQVEDEGSEGAGAILQLLGELLGSAIVEDAKALTLLELVLDSTPLETRTDAALVFQGLCLKRICAVVERRLTDVSGRRQLEVGVWGPNLEGLSSLLADRVYLGAFAQRGAVRAVLEFLLAVLRAANADRAVELLPPPSRSSISRRRRGGGLNFFVFGLLRSANRLVMYSFLPPLLTGLSQEEARGGTRLGSQAWLANRGAARESALDCTLDPADAVRLLVSNSALLLCPANEDAELLSCLCHNLTHWLWDKDESVRRLAVEGWKVLLSSRAPDLGKLLMMQDAHGQSINILHGGFDILLGKGVVDFFEWLRLAEDDIYEVLEHKISPEWMEVVNSSAKFPSGHMKSLENRRRQEHNKRVQNTGRLKTAWSERRRSTGRALDGIREAIARELRVRRQDKYGWVLHAKREWQGRLRELVHERGLWPMWGGAGAEAPVQWQLCATEGRFRMRRRLERCKVHVDLHAARPILPLGETAPGRAEEETVGSGKKSEKVRGGLPGDELTHLFSLGRGVVFAKPQRTFSRLLDKDFWETAEEELAAVEEGEEKENEEEGRTGVGSKANTETMARTAAQGRENEDNKQGNPPPNAGVAGWDEWHEDDVTSQTGSMQTVEFNRGLSQDLTAEVLKEVQDDGEHLIRPHLMPGDRIRHKYNCERVVGLDKRDGIFLIGELCLYVIENFYLDSFGRICEKRKEEEVSVLDRALGVDKAPFHQGKKDLGRESDLVGGWADTAAAWREANALGVGGEGEGEREGEGEGWGALHGARVGHECNTWKLDDVHELLKRRYQLRPVALELFSMSGNNDLLVFHISERDSCFNNLLALNLPRTSMLDATISGARSEKAEPGQLFGRMARTLRSRWLSGEISNFQYLMHLNTLAGRGYNDLTQYPVFPWVLADYGSPDLDLSRPETFRPLHKPMGCLTPEREREFKKRYEAWDDPEIPKFHYGSHYSSAGIVLYYLIRLPPFSRENQQLQGGHFDHADRLFTSVAETWKSASSGNTADVKELTPEFFYMPKILENRFHLDLGLKQSGERVGDVALPPWAQGSARIFIQKHREALESPYVSEHLHEWINLIFGYQQQGKAAIEETNVFFHLTYEGAVDIDSIKDPRTKASILAQINHFGQTPRQLFLKPHPKRKAWQQAPLIHALRHSYLLTPQKIRSMPAPITQILLIRDKLGVLVGDSLMKPPSYDKALYWGFPDGSLRVVAAEQDRLLSIHEGLHSDGAVQCAAVSRDGEVLATGGGDGLVAVWRLPPEGTRGTRRLQLQRTLCAHSQAITTLALCQPWSMLLSGSDDRTVVCWDLNTLEFIRQLAELPAPVTAVHMNDMTGKIVTAAGTALGVWSMNGDCLASINTSLVIAESITCISTPIFSDWMETHWYITGHRHGSIKIWSLEYQYNPEQSGLLQQGGVIGSFNAGSSGSSLGKPGAELQAVAEEFLGTGDAAHSGALFEPRRTPDFQLLLRRELVWHQEPVTALFLSPDLRQLFSGDRGGRVAEWALPEETSEQADDDGRPVTPPPPCKSCKRYLKLKESRHSCSSCGRVVCSDCGSSRISLEDLLGHSSPVRVCSDCLEARQAQGRHLQRAPSLAVVVPSATSFHQSLPSPTLRAGPKGGPPPKKRPSYAKPANPSL